MAIDIMHQASGGAKRQTNYSVFHYIPSIYIKIDLLFTLQPFSISSYHFDQPCFSLQQRRPLPTVAAKKTALPGQAEVAGK
jgi:hypothetical protein